MKKTFKRLGAMFLAMAMAVSVLCTGALAANTAQSGPFTITVKNETSGYTYAAYQVFKGDLATDSSNNKILSNITWGEGVDSAKTDDLLNAIKNIDGTNSNKPFADCSDAASVATVLGDSTTATTDVVKAFAKVVGEYLSSTAQGTTNTLVTANSDSCTHTDGKDAAHYDISVQNAGYYLVKNTAVPNNTTTDTAYTNYILEVVGNVQVSPKSSVPTVTKKIVEDNEEKDATTANIGDPVTFKLTATLPNNYADYDKYELTFHDTLSKGLTFNEDSITVVAKSSNTEDTTEINLTKNTDYTVNTKEAVSEEEDLKCTFEVAISDMKTNNQLKDLPAGSTITVTYTATLNKDASLGTTGNSNKVKLEYSNNPNKDTDKGNTPEDEVKVYTFQLNVVKNNDKNQALSGAKFVLATKQLTKTEGETTTNVNVITTNDITTYKDSLVAVNGSAPTYTVGGTDYEMEVNSEGKLNIKGLKDGTYYLYETKAPDGYNKLTKPIKIEIKAGEDSKTVGGDEIKTPNGKVSAKVDDNTTIDEVTTGILDKVTVVNKSGSTLPSTGGMGTTLFYVIGGVLMAGAAIVLVIKKKRSSAE